ncbi:MAG: hypothetical protein ACXVCE_11250 [Bacteriovorax sp.]
MRSMFIVMSLFTVLVAQPAFAGNSCKAFVTIGEPTGNPPASMDCKGKTKDIKSCIKACIKTVEKTCAKGQNFTINANFNGAEGFAAEAAEGKCKH